MPACSLISQVDKKTEAILCPPQTIVEWVHFPFGSVVVETGKGFYSEEYHSLDLFIKGLGWITVEEYEEWEKQEQDKEKRLQSF